MSMFEDGRYRWRETYFVQFDKQNRPMLAEVEKRLAAMGNQFETASPRADCHGRLESITVLAPEDYAALDISYLEGEEVLEQGAQFAEELTASCCAKGEKKKLELLRRHEGRFDVLHFEQIDEDGENGDEDEMLDPSSLLLIIDLLVELTDGVAVDPQGGTIM